MYLESAPKSKRFGYQIPKSFIDVGPNNITRMVQDPQTVACINTFGGNTIDTKFEKVRIEIVRLKNKSFKENINCADFTYTKKVPGQKNIICNHNNSMSDDYQIYDKAMYAHA